MVVIPVFMPIDEWVRDEVRRHGSWWPEPMNLFHEQAVRRETWGAAVRAARVAFYELPAELRPADNPSGLARAEPGPGASHHTAGWVLTSYLDRTGRWVPDGDGAVERFALYAGGAPISDDRARELLAGTGHREAL